ncbi:MAG: glycosyltransferase [Planctomycetota bacterium]
MRKLRTLHVNTEKTWRGGEQQELYLLKGLRERGHLVHSIAQPGSPMSEKAKNAGIETIEVRMRAEADALAVKELAEIMRRGKYDLVHSHTSHGHFLTWIAAYFGGRPLRVVSRRVDFSIYRHIFSLSWLKYIHGADLYICVSDAVRKVLIADGIPPERVQVVHSGIDVGRFNGSNGLNLRDEFRLPGNTFVIGNVGHMASHKGQATLLEAIPILKKSFTDFRVFIVGDGRLREQLIAHSKRLGVEDVVVFTGFRNDVPDLLGFFDVFVMPSTMEGLGTSILDALAAGTPVVATRVGGIPEIIEDRKTGYLVPPHNPIVLAEAIGNLLNNPDRAKDFAGAGRRRINEKFAVSGMVEATEGAYYRRLARGRYRNRH